VKRALAILGTLAITLGVARFFTDETGDARGPLADADVEPEEGAERPRVTRTGPAEPVRLDEPRPRAPDVDPEVDELESLSPEERERVMRERESEQLEERRVQREERDLERLRETIERLAQDEDLSGETVEELDLVSSDYLMQITELQDATRGDREGWREGLDGIRAEHRREVEALLGPELADVYLEMHRGPLRDIGER